MAVLHVEVNGVRLAFVVDGGPRPAPGEPARARLLALRGGPEPETAGPDPSERPADGAEVVWLDQRGSGASEAGPSGLRHLEQWAWDVRVFCAALGVERPVVAAAGANAAVALLYAARNRAHPAGLVLRDPLWERERIAPWLRPDRDGLDLAPELARVACPVLALATGAAGADSARALAALLPGNARVERLPGVDPAAARVLTGAFLVGLED